MQSSRARRGGNGRRGRTAGTEIGYGPDVSTRRTDRTGDHHRSGEDRLETYRRRRRATRTPEPIPQEGALPAGNDDTFVVQEHHARRLHWDLRLERGGALVSWAIPKGIPTDPATDRLAVHTEDHPLEYAAFAGEIPKGEYGGGRVEIWDRGTYETEKWTDREVKVIMHGTRVRGRYVLFRIRDRDWMIHRMDPAVDPDAEPPPEHIAPMRAVRRTRLPGSGADPRYAFEFGWGGERLLAVVEFGRLRLRDADGRDVTRDHGWLRGLGETNATRQLLLDGEVIEPEGRKVYVIFDLLHLDGRSLLERPYAERRRRLDALRPAGPHWQVAPWYVGDGPAVRQAARRQGVPGVVAKRLDAPYEPGVTSRQWVLVPVAPTRR